MRFFLAWRKLCNDDHKVKTRCAKTHRRPPLRRGRLHHGGFAMKPSLHADAPDEEGTIFAEMSAVHTEPSQYRSGAQSFVRISWCLDGDDERERCGVE